MNITVDLTSLHWDGWGGDATPVALDLVKALARRRNVHLEILTVASNHALLRQVIGDSGAEFIMVSLAKPLLDLPRARLWRRVWKKIRYGDRALLFFPANSICYRQEGIPMVGMIHDVRHEYYPQFFEPKDLGCRRNFCMEISQSANAIVCVSNDIKAAFTEKYQYPEADSFVVHNGVKQQLNQYNENLLQKCIEELGLKGKSFAFYPANFGPHKNHRILLMAFAGICHRYPQYGLQLVLAGNRLEMPEDLQQAIVSMGIADRVHCLGILKEPVLAALYNYCSFVIYPSLYEGFCIPAVEAMRLGKPVLCSDRTSLPEVAGEGALYFDPRIPDEMEAAMLKILTDEALKKELKRKGLEQAKKFTMGNMAEQYMAVFRSVIQK